MVASWGTALKWKTRARRQNNDQLQDKTGNNERWSDNDGMPLANQLLQLDEASLNAIITGVSEKLMSNPPVSGGNAWHTCVAGVVTAEAVD